MSEDVGVEEEEEGRAESALGMWEQEEVRDGELRITRREGGSRMGVLW